MKENYCSQETVNLLKDKGIELGEKPTLQEVWEWLYDRGIFISVTPCYATEVEPFRWEVNKKQEGSWGGSATYYAREKYGDASSPDKALERAIVWVLENLM